jgi:hypothetical protein
MRVGVAGDREWVASVDHYVSLRVTDQKERHRHLETAETECAALEQIELKAARHAAILDRSEDCSN